MDVQVDVQVDGAVGIRWRSDDYKASTYMRAGISRGAAKGRKRHDSGPYIHTYILGGIFSLLNDSQVLI